VGDGPVCIDRDSRNAKQAGKTPLVALREFLT